MPHAVQTVDGRYHAVIRLTYPSIDPTWEPTVLARFPATGEIARVPARALVLTDDEDWEILVEQDLS